MNQKECPECWKEISVNSKVCPFCGYSFLRSASPKAGIKTAASCPNCRHFVYINDKICNYCGYSLERKKGAKAESIITGIVFFLISIMLLLYGITRVTNDTYKYYKDNYYECLNPYIENMSLYFKGGILSDLNKEIADSYKELMNYDEYNLYKLRIKCTIFVLIGILFFLLGLIFFLGYLPIKSAPGKAKQLNIRNFFKAKTVIACEFTAGGSVFITSIIVLVFSINAYKVKPIESGYFSDSVSGYNHSYLSTPKTGNEGALAQAESYLATSAFSYTGLIEQLEYHGFSESEAIYGANYCGADWKEQALRQAKSYLRNSSFSYTGLIEQLEYEGFSPVEATYGVDNCNADWKYQAVQSAKSYLRHGSWTKSELIDQLDYEGFTYDEVIYGVDHCGETW